MLRVLCVFLISLLMHAETLHAQTDTSIGLETTGKFGTDFIALAADICLDLPSEQQKANAIYNWVTHNIEYDVKALRKFPKADGDKAFLALKNRKAVCDGYAMLYTELCKAAGLQAVNIEGYAKDWIFDNGDELYIPRHEWNAVRINGKWQLVDATWGAGGLYQKESFLVRLYNVLFRHGRVSAKSLRFRYQYNPNYFMQDPEVFRLKHLPSDPLWQLTDTAMPVSVFEAGDSSVKVFNELYSKPKQSDPRLDKIALLDEKQKVFEYADRAYAFNNRFPLILSLKNNYRALSLIDRAVSDTLVSSPDLMLKDAKNDLKKSLDHIKDQKKSFPAEYSKLKQKNRAKGLVAKQHIRRIKTDDKRLIAQTKKYTKASDTKGARAKKVQVGIATRIRKVDARKIDEVQTAKVKKKNDAPELLTILDSVKARDIRISLMKVQINAKSVQVKNEIVASSTLLDSLVLSLGKEDSMIRKEANERINMHDSYDDEVRKWSGLLVQQKYYVSDTLMKRYLEAFDTVTTHFVTLQKVHLQTLDQYKSNLRSLEQYRKWNNTDEGIKKLYADCSEEYTAAADSAMKDNNIYMQYLKGNKMVFGVLGKANKRQIRIVEYMEKAEKNRQNVEAGTIVRKKAFDMKENEIQRMAVQKGLKRMQRIVDQIDGVR